MQSLIGILLILIGVIYPTAGLFQINNLLKAQSQGKTTLLRVGVVASWNFTFALACVLSAFALLSPEPWTLLLYRSATIASLVFAAIAGLALLVGVGKMPSGGRQTREEKKS